MAIDMLFYLIFPYVAITLAVIGWIYRISYDKYSVSSQSSEFLGDKETLLFGSYFWHYSIIAILSMHILGILFPDLFNRLVTDSNREFWEYTGWALAGFSILGMAILIYRRITNERVRAVTTAADWIVLGDLSTQIVTGMTVAIKYRFGSQWFISTMVPWLRSLFTLNPNYSTVAGFAGSDWLLHLHFVNGMVLIAMIPFTRLGHLMLYPIRYAWRTPQIVIWNRSRGN
ncbi:MAG: respiratory nitrate reductase subunit gamma [Methanobacteriota archaeon]|nr:MAG: respiratory nitrate reductase subunit gamma [Euryarchaeota archaeon]